MESNQAGPFGRQGYSLVGVRPRLMLRSGATSWIRTNLLSLFRRALIHLSYSGEIGGAVENRTRTVRVQAGLPSQRTTPFGAPCRLSACDPRFVGPTLFTSELRGCDWRPLAVTLRSHRVDSSAATLVASEARLAADLRLERSASGLTVRFPHLVGLSAK